MRRIAEVRAAGNRDKRFTGSQSTTFHSTDRHGFVEIERLHDLSERACLSKLRAGRYSAVLRARGFRHAL